MHLEAKMSLGSNSHLGGCLQDTTPNSNLTDNSKNASKFSSNLPSGNTSNFSNNINNNNANENKLDPEAAEVLKREAWLSPDVRRRRLVPISNGEQQEELYPNLISPNPHSEPIQGNNQTNNTSGPKTNRKLNQVFEPHCSPPNMQAPSFDSDLLKFDIDEMPQYSSENLTISDFKKRTDSYTTEEVYSNSSDDENSYSLVCASEQFLPGDDFMDNDDENFPKKSDNIPEKPEGESNSSIVFGSVQVRLPLLKAH